MTQTKREQVISHIRYLRQELREMHLGIKEDDLFPDPGELRGLIDKNTRGLKEGSTLILELRPAGQKLKLQLKVQKLDNNQKEIQKKDNGSDIGPVLNWDPQTGSLQLSQNATQKLLASLGGHVTQRRDTGLTVFFPISDAK